MGWGAVAPGDRCPGHGSAHLEQEIAFAERAAATFAAQAEWRPILGDQPIERFVAESGVSLEPSGR